MLQLQTEHNAVIVPVKVVPGASQSRYVGEWDGHAKLTVAAPPEKGKANRAVVDLMAKIVGVRRKDVTILAGQTSSTKKVRIVGATTDQVSAAFERSKS